MGRIVLYVVCHDDASAAKAAYVAEFFAPHAIVWKMPQTTHLFEGCLYAGKLMERYHEWAEADFVGTVTYAAMDKLYSMWAIKNILNNNALNVDAVMFVPNTTAFWEGHNECVRRVFDGAAVATGLAPPDGPRLSDGTLWCYSNYWIARPSFMSRYCTFFTQQWLPAVDAQAEAWNDAGYKNGHLSREALVSLTGHAHYTCHPFVNERLVYAFLVSIGARIYQ